MSDPVLRARGVARRFGSQVALEPTDVDVHASETLALIGPNGAGKSTLLALLAGACTRDAHRVTRRSARRDAGVFLGPVPREVVPVAGWLSDGLPFAHAVRYFSASLYDASPWNAVVRELAWLAGLGLVFGALARLATRRLLA